MNPVASSNVLILYPSKIWVLTTSTVFSLTAVSISSLKLLQDWDRKTITVAMPESYKLEEQSDSSKLAEIGFPTYLKRWTF